MSEVWKDIKGFEKYYKISNKGRVKSVFHNDGLILKQGIGCGYLNVHFYRNGKRYIRYIHRLVAKHFVDNPLNKKTVNHKNGIKTDNREDNLEWLTQKENVQHAWNLGLCEALKNQDGKGVKNYNSILLDTDVLQIRSLYQNGWFNYKELSEAYDVSISTIAKIVTRKRWTHI